MKRAVRPAIAGALAAGVALGVGELLGAVLSGAPSLILAVGALVIDLQPPGAKQFVVDLFGEADKLVLNLVIVGAALAAGGGLGIGARHRFWVGTLGFAVGGAVGLHASLQEPLVTPTLAVLTVAAAVGAGLFTLSRLLRAAADSSSIARIAQMPEWSRRRFLLLSAGAATVALAAGGIGRFLLEQGRMTSPQRRVAIPEPVEPRLALRPAHGLDVPGITPIVVPNEDFYRIDTALLVPRIDAATWRLTVKGMVERQLEFSYDELLAMPLFEQFVTIACVSNEVGGDLVGNASWRGVRLRDVLEMAGVRQGATQIVGRAFDGWTAGFPTAWAMDRSRESMIAVEMNGEPLPLAHGFPARLIVPGLFGYVSATKWLTEIELTTLEAFDAYWVPLGWAKEAPILTQSRIDVPRSRASLAAGTIPVAGVAWAPDRGIRAVEVSIDDGSWRRATLSDPISDATWVQWRYDWNAEPGRHGLAVRATDGNGEVQTAERTPPPPDGARGHHRIEVTVD